MIKWAGRIFVFFGIAHLLLSFALAAQTTSDLVGGASGCPTAASRR